MEVEDAGLAQLLRIFRLVHLLRLLGGGGVVGVHGVGGGFEVGPPAGGALVVGWSPQQEGL